MTNHTTLHPVAWFLGYDEDTRGDNEPDLSSEDIKTIATLVEVDDMQGYLTHCRKYGITGMDAGITAYPDPEDIYQDLRQLMTIKLEWS